MQDHPDNAPNTIQLPRSMSQLVVLGMCLSFAAFAGRPVFGQEAVQKVKPFPLLNWDGGITCRSKGRLQDKGYCESRIMDQIVAQGKNAIPVLISQLTDTRELKEPAFDFWNRMTVGDLANSILYDLFTDSDWKTFNMPGLKIIMPKCDVGAEQCWHVYVKKHGMKFVQEQWSAAWNATKDRVYWDTQAKCFRQSPKVKSTSGRPKPQLEPMRIQ
jgi:hypothetical protein